MCINTMTTGTVAWCINFIIKMPKENHKVGVLMDSEHFLLNKKNVLVCPL